MAKRSRIRATNAPADTRRAGIYLRISEDRTGREAGVRRQEKECRELSERVGWEVVDVYQDNDVSAYSGKRRPEYERMKADLRAGRIDAVVAWHPDRLYRRSRDLLDVIDLVNDVRAEVATVQANTVDLATPNGRLVAKIGADVAEHESEQKAERVKAWHRQRAEAGLPGGGRRPFGFERGGLQVRESEARLIREAAQRVLSGNTVWSVVCDWNARGVPTVTGTNWTPVALGGMLRSPRIAGLREHNGTIYPAAWQAILDGPTWDGLRDIAARRTRPGRPAEYLLSGIARCSLCGTGMTGNKTARGVKGYRCPPANSNGRGRGKVARNAAKLDNYVRDMLIAAVAGPALTEALAARAAIDDTSREAVAVVEANERRLDELKREYSVECMWTKVEFLAHKTELEHRIAEASGRLQPRGDARELAGLPSDSDGLLTWWDSANVQQQRALIGLVINKVEVLPTVRGGRTFDPERVAISWCA